jgi:hypothetical protein
MCAISTARSLACSLRPCHRWIVPYLCWVDVGCDWICPNTVAMGYVPDGLSADQYRKLKEKEQADLKSKKLGAFGPQSFKSRSLLAFQTDLEKGKAGHLMPVFNAQEKLKRGEIKKEDIPYMQRLGSWDGTDIGKKQKGNDKDKRYNANERPANGLDWSGRGPSMGGPKSAAKKPTAAAAPKKKMGWF